MSTAETLIARHFGTRYGERDDAAHLATYAQDAFLVLGDRAATRAEVSDADVLEAWARIPVGEPRFGAPRVTAFTPFDGTALARVRLEEATSGEAIAVVVGLAEEDGDWRVAFVGLDTAADGFERARLSALAELTSLRFAALAAPRASLLEVAFARTRQMPKQRLLSLPETRFSCQGTGSCCKHELTIGLDDGARRFVEAIDWRSVDTAIAPGPYAESLPAAAHDLVSFRHKLKREGTRCKFLTPDNRCAIHALAGRAVFNPCHAFPYRFTWSPDGVCVTTHAMCPTARCGLGAPLEAQEADLRSRLAVAEVFKTETFRLRPGDLVDWETFRTIEGQLLELLNGEAPMKRKLLAASRWLGRRLKNENAAFDPDWLLWQPERLNWISRMGLKRFGALFDGCFADLKRLPAGDSRLQDHEAELTRFFRSLLFSKATTYPYGLVAGFNYLVLVYHVLERQVARRGRKGLSEAFWQEFYAVVLSGSFLRMLGVFHANPGTLFSRYSGSPEFGLSLLRL
ncbi:MAG TPA: hypothetical protein V6D47_08615 [Oscillatoriaceae cyanobacterium]